METSTIIVAVILLLIFVVLLWSSRPATPQTFYSVDDTFPELGQIHPLRSAIMAELSHINDQKWNPWPEKELYGQGSWKIFPLYAFGVWAEDNCRQVPVLTRFVKSLPNMRLATLSKLSPKLKLEPHRGWGSHSNHVLRCHYGIDIPSPDSCYIRVNGDVQYHQNDRWLVFDDSEEHMAENKSDKDRLVLIIDMARPASVPLGTSEVGDTRELMEIVNYFRDRQKS
jgi:aspartyl/asparaginyl beta-hydroxylase (cupin superfamily)